MCFAHCCNHVAPQKLLWFLNSQPFVLVGSLSSCTRLILAAMFRDDMATVLALAQQRRRSMFGMFRDDVATLANNPQLNDFVNSVIWPEIDDSFQTVLVIDDSFLANVLEAIRGPG